MDQARRPYPSNLSDQQWELIKIMIPPARHGGRKRTTDMRRVVEALLYLVRTGAAWRYLPQEFPPWKTVYYYFSKWSAQGVWAEMNTILTRILREKSGRNRSPSLGIVDSQSVKAHYGEARGWDGFKKVRGRKRHLIVDTLGLILSCAVYAANERDPHGGVRALDQLPSRFLDRLKTILGDAAYVGPFDDVAWFHYGIKVERKKASNLESNLKPKRWIVERTFAWFNHFRRLSRDYERKLQNSESIIYLAMVAIMIKRIAP